MSERLTDEDLAFHIRMTSGDVNTLLRELRSRRAAELKPDEIEALRAFIDGRCIVRNECSVEYEDDGAMRTVLTPIPVVSRALDILSRLTGAK